MGAAGLAVGCGDGVPAEPFSVGAVTDHAVGVWKLYPAQHVIVGRDANGYFAYSTLCTHEGTEVAFRDATACTAPTGCTSQSATGHTQCPNHFSQFDGNGMPTRSPATVTLPHYRVSIAAGELTVHPEANVEATARSLP